MASTRIIMALAAISLCSGRLAAQGSGPTAAELVERADAVMNPVSFISRMEMVNESPDGKTTRNVTVIRRKGDKMLAIVQSPAIQRGQAILRSGDDMWMYFPKSGKIARIGAKERSLGGEVSNTDLFRIDLSLDYDAVLLGRESLSGEDCWKLELKARRRSLVYDHVLYWITVDGCLPLRREFYALSGKLLRSMRFSGRGKLPGWNAPADILIVNEVNPGYRSYLSIVEMRSGAPIKDAMLTVAWLESGGSAE